MTRLAPRLNNHAPAGDVICQLECETLENQRVTLRTGRVVASRGRNDKRLVVVGADLLQHRQHVRTNSAYHEVDIVTRDDLLCHFAANFRIELIVALYDLHWTARNLAATLLESELKAVSNAFAEIRVNPGIRQDQTYFERIGAERITEWRRRRDSGAAQRERCLGKGAARKSDVLGHASPPTGLCLFAKVSVRSQLSSNGFDFVTVYFGQANRACD